MVSEELVQTWIKRLSSSHDGFEEIFGVRGCDLHYKAWSECFTPEHVDILIDAIQAEVAAFPKHVKPVDLFGTGTRGVALINSDVSIARHLEALLDVSLPPIDGADSVEEQRPTVLDLVRGIFAWHVTGSESAFNRAVTDMEFLFGELDMGLFTSLELPYVKGKHENRVTAQALAYQSLRKMDDRAALTWDDHRRRYAFSPSLREMESWATRASRNLSAVCRGTSIAAHNNVLIHAGNVAKEITQLKSLNDLDHQILHNAEGAITQSITVILDELRTPKLNAFEILSLLKGHSESFDGEWNHAILNAILANNCLVGARSNLEDEEQQFLLSLIKAVHPEENRSREPSMKIDNQTNERLLRTLTRKRGRANRLSAIQEASLALIDAPMWNDLKLKYPRSVPVVKVRQEEQFRIPNSDLGIEESRSNRFPIAQVIGIERTQRGREEGARRDALRLAIALEWFGVSSVLRARELLKSQLLTSIDKPRAISFSKTAEDALGTFECDDTNVLERVAVGDFRILRHRRFLESATLVMHDPKRQNEDLSLEIAGRFFIRERVIAYCDHEIPMRHHPNRESIGRQVARICNPFRDVPKRNEHREDREIKDILIEDLYAVEKAYFWLLRGGDENALVPVEFEISDGMRVVRRVGVPEFHELLGRFLRIIPPREIHEEPEPLHNPFQRGVDDEALMGLEADEVEVDEGSSQSGRKNS
jgi:hypothetical protein